VLLEQLLLVDLVHLEDLAQVVVLQVMEILVHLDLILTLVVVVEQVEVEVVLEEQEQQHNQDLLGLVVMEVQDQHFLSFLDQHSLRYFQQVGFLLSVHQDCLVVGEEEQMKEILRQLV
jgi:hypothetical protein